MDRRDSQQPVYSLLSSWLHPVSMVLLPSFLNAEPASASYLDITCDCNEVLWRIVEREGYTRFQVRCSGGYRARDYAVEGDFSSASYFFAIAATAGWVR